MGTFVLIRPAQIFYERIKRCAPETPTTIAEDESSWLDGLMELIYQPSDSNSLADYLNEGFAGPWTHFRAAIAFVKRSGTRHIDGGLASFARNHDVEIIAGIDHRGTSYEGLESLLHAVSPSGRVLIFHNPTFRTFHPKIYLFKSSVAADMVVGSGNLTGGGLFANYEAGIRLRLNLANPNEAAILMEVERVLDRWSDLSGDTARLLDQQLLTKLAAWGLAPSELLVTPTPSGEQGDIGDLTVERDDFPFKARSELGLPPFSTHRQHTPVIGITRATLGSPRTKDRFRDDAPADRRRCGTDDIGNLKAFT